MPASRLRAPELALWTKQLPGDMRRKSMVWPESYHLALPGGSALDQQGNNIAASTRRTAVCVPRPYGGVGVAGCDGPQAVSSIDVDQPRTGRVTSLLLSLALWMSLSLLSLGHTSARAVTFADLRSDLLGNEVVVLGDVSQIDGCAKDWSFVEGDVATGFKFRTGGGGKSGCVPKSLLGKRAIVVSIELDSKILFKQTGENNAFGDQLIRSRVPNQFTILVVKIVGEDIQIGLKSFPNTIWEDNLRLAKDYQASNSEIEANLRKLLGRNLYHNGYTQLLPTSLSIDDLVDGSKRNSLRDRNTQNLTILKVVDTKHLVAENAVLIKLVLPDGGERLLFGSLQHYNLKRGYVPTLLERMGVSAAEGIPRKFSQREMTAIKIGSIFRGMSEDALYWSIGYPKDFNDWGLSGLQLIYNGGRFVYIRNKLVADWQSLAF